MHPPNIVKLCHLLRMMLGVAFGLEPEVRSSKQLWRAGLRKQVLGGGQHAG